MIIIFIQFKVSQELFECKGFLFFIKFIIQKKSFVLLGITHIWIINIICTFISLKFLSSNNISISKVL